MDVLPWYLLIHTHFIPQGRIKVSHKVDGVDLQGGLLLLSSLLWQRIGQSVTLIGALQTNRTETMNRTHDVASEFSKLMEGITAGTLIPEIVRRGFQELLEAEVSALTVAQLHKSCPDQRSTHRNGYPDACSPPRRAT